MSETQGVTFVYVYGPAERQPQRPQAPTSTHPGAPGMSGRAAQFSAPTISSPAAHLSMRRFGRPSVRWSLAIQEPKFTSARDGLVAGGSGQFPVGQRNPCPDHGRGHEHAAARLAGSCILGSVVELLMSEKRCDAGHQRVGPADPAKLCSCLPVIQGGIIAAHAADDLERAGAAVRMPVAGARRPTPKCNYPVRLVLVTSHLHGPLAKPAVHAAVRCGLSRCPAGALLPGPEHMVAHAGAPAQLTDAQQRAIPGRLHGNTIHSFDSNLTILLRRA
jgi:hypothetical protein